jgi:hypothetical protein
VEVAWFLIPLTLANLGLVLFARDRYRRLRHSAMMAALCGFLFVTALTESLSLVGSVSWRPLVTAWVLAALGSSVWAYKGVQWERLSLALGRRFRRCRGWVGVWLTWVVVVLAFLAALGALTPPNTWDSMTYHMPRVAHWAQQGSVAFYPTSIPRQNYQAPLAEWAVLHLQILSGSDRLAFAVQWLAFALCALTASLVAQELASPWPLQVLAAVLVVSLPMGILQSTTTQNDLVAASWTLSFTYLLLRTIRGFRWPLVVAAGAALGLALLTKGTAYFFAGPMGVSLMAYSWLRVRRSAWTRRRWLSGVAIVLIALCILSGHSLRVRRLYGYPLPGNKAAARIVEPFVNRRHGLPAIWANVVRTLALHVSIPVAAWNDGVRRAAVTLIAKDELAHPDTTYGRRPFELRPDIHEDISGNPLHFVLIASSLAALLVGAKGTRSRSLTLLYASGLIGGAILITLVLRWQPWQSRLHTPGFVLAVPLAVAIAGQLWPTSPREWLIRAGLPALFLVCSLPWLTLNRAKPLVGPHSIFTTSRRDQYFANDRRRLDAYRDALSIVTAKHPALVGLTIVEEWEYPIWAWLAGGPRPGPRIEHVNVTDVSRRLAHDLPPVDLIVSIAPWPQVVQGIHFVPTWTSDWLSLLEPAAPTQR